MSDFFGDIASGMRFPATQINQGGPLPDGPYTGYDGVINAGGELLGKITPYGGPKGLPVGSDKNYQQIPHRSQQIIPPLYLPHADKRERSKIKVSHGVDQGDIAFILVSDRIANLVMAQDMPGPRVQAPGRNAFCNLPTLNYMLAGLQRLTGSDKPRQCEWAQMAEDFGYKWSNGKGEKLDIYGARDEVLKLISTRMIPFGICAGSEKQGGQHEMGLAPVQAAVSHVTTMTVDGQNRDLVNYWRAVGLERGGRSGISAGDELIFRLAYLKTQRYTLNHYYKGMATAIFGGEEECWQLVPDKFEMDAERNQEWSKFQRKYGGQLYDYRVDGYWRVGQTFQHRLAHDSNVENYSNDLCFMRGQLLQITFAPMWVQMDGKPKKRRHVEEVRTAEVVQSARTKRKGGSFAWDSDDDDNNNDKDGNDAGPKVVLSSPRMDTTEVVAETPMKTSETVSEPPTKSARFTAIRTKMVSEEESVGENPFLVAAGKETGASVVPVEEREKPSVAKKVTVRKVGARKE